MYLGKVVELADARDINERLMHPYTEALFSAMPLADSAAAARHRIVLSGEIPSAIDPPPGCAFALRCGYDEEICSHTAPSLDEIDGRLMRCHFAGRLPIGAMMPAGQSHPCDRG